MATIRKIARKKGITYQVILKDKFGNALKTKTFGRLLDARAWAKRIEGDDDHMEALGMSGGARLFSDLLDEYVGQWKGRGTKQAYRLSYWRRELGSYKIIDITTQLLRQKIKEFHRGQCRCGDVSKSQKRFPGRDPMQLLTAIG